MPRKTGETKRNGETYTAQTGETYHDGVLHGLELAKGKRMNKETRALCTEKSGVGVHSASFGQLINMEAGDNTRIAQVSMKLFLLPDIDLNDPAAVANRLAEYFQIYADADLKPAVSGMALSLNGHERKWLWALSNDQPYTGKDTYVKINPVSVGIIKKAYKMLEAQWEGYTTSGKMNPIPAIFLGKNNFGYVDRVETVVKDSEPDYTDLTTTDIAKRYD